MLTGNCPWVFTHGYNHLAANAARIPSANHSHALVNEWAEPIRVDVPLSFDANEHEPNTDKCHFRRQFTELEMLLPDVAVVFCDRFGF